MATLRKTTAGRSARRSGGSLALRGQRQKTENELKDIFLSSNLAHPGESWKEFQACCREFFVEHEPIGPYECSLVQQLAFAHWRILRLRKRLAEEIAHPVRDTLQVVAGIERFLKLARRSYSRALRSFKAARTDKRHRSEAAS